MDTNGSIRIAMGILLMAVNKVYMFVRYNSLNVI